MTDKDLQNLIMQAQSYQQQLQMVTSQKEALSMQTLEIGKALEELSKPGKEDVYRIAGPILIKVGKADAVKDLKSKRDISAIRIKSVNKSETGLKEKLEELKEKLTKAGA